MNRTAQDILKKFEAAGIQIRGTPIICCGYETALGVELIGTVEEFGRFGKLAYLVGDVDHEYGVEVVYAHSEAEAKAIGATWLDFADRHVQRAAEYDHYLAQGGVTERQLFEHHDWHFPCAGCENEAVTSDEGKWVCGGPMCIDCLEERKTVVACRQTECQRFRGHGRPDGEIICAGMTPPDVLLIATGDPMPSNAQTCHAFLSVGQAVLPFDGGADPTGCDA
jgi:hypothetical protein